MKKPKSEALLTLLKMSTYSLSVCLIRLTTFAKVYMAYKNEKEFNVTKTPCEKTTTKHNPES